MAPRVPVGDEELPPTTRKKLDRYPPAVRCAYAKAFERDEDGNKVLDADGNPIRRRCKRYARRGSDRCTSHNRLAHKEEEARTVAVLRDLREMQKEYEELIRKARYQAAEGAGDMLTVLKDIAEDESLAPGVRQSAAGMFLRFTPLAPSAGSQVTVLAGAEAVVAISDPSAEIRARLDRLAAGMTAVTEREARTIEGTVEQTT